MLRLAITGGIGCGKSLLGDILKEMGCAVIDADSLGRVLLRRGQPVYEAVVAGFGPGLLDGNARIDRKRLAARVFRDPAALRELNALMHPEIRRRWRLWMDARERDGCPAAAVQIPLFYETGEFAGDWDCVICVVAPARVCRRRLSRRGWTARAIAQRNRAQWPPMEKAGRADVVLDNSGLPAWLRRQAALFYRNKLAQSQAAEGTLKLEK